MKIDEIGLPRDTGASDLQDSSRLAGVMTVFEMLPIIPITKYVVDGKYVRHPGETRYDFSRDQALCLMSGLYRHGRSDLVHREWVDGKDWFSPSHFGHVRRCKGLKANWFQDMWLWLDVFWSCFVSPLAEPNQLLCMLMIADKKFLRFWVKHNSKWEKSITEYWCEGPGAWRGEQALAEHMINYIKERV